MRVIMRKTIIKIQGHNPIVYKGYNPIYYKGYGGVDGDDDENYDDNHDWPL